MFIAAVSGAGLAALDHAIDGYAYLVVPAVIVICYLLAMARKPTPAAAATDNEVVRLTPRIIARALTRPFLVTFAGASSFLQVFGYLRGIP